MEDSRGKYHQVFIKPITLLVLVITSIFASTALVDLILSAFSPLSLDIRRSLMDALLMVIILFPVMYFLVYEPLTSSIKDLNRSEEALQASEAKFRSLVETTDDSIYLVSRNYEYLFMNTKHRTRMGFFGDEYTGRAFSEFHSQEATRVFTEEVAKVLATKDPFQHKHRSERDGRYFLRTLSPVKGPNGELVAVSVVSKDVTRLMEEGEAEFDQSPSGISTGKRQEVRHNCYFPVQFALSDDIDEALKAVVLNFSDSGLCINSSIPLKRGQKVIMKGSVPSRHHEFRVQWSSALMAGLFAQSKN